MNERWQNMSHEARTLIDLAKGVQGEGPTVSDRERVRRGVALRLAAGTALAATLAPPAAAAPSAAGVALAGWVKASLVAVVLSSGVGGAWLLRNRDDESAVKIHTRPTTTITMTNDPASSAGSRADTLTLQPPPAAKAAPRPREHRKKLSAPQPRAVNSSETFSVEVATSDLANETAHLRQVHTALSANNAEGALVALDKYYRLFSSGVMREEADATRVLVLCKANRQDEARRFAREFLQRTPESPLAPRVRASCGMPSQ